MILWLLFDFEWVKVCVVMFSIICVCLKVVLNEKKCVFTHILGRLVAMFFVKLPCFGGIRRGLCQGARGGGFLGLLHG